MIIWSNKAKAELRTCLRNIAEYAGYQSAEKHYQAFMHSLSLAEQFPYSGRLNRLGYREVFPKQYRIVYEIVPSGINVITLKHQKQRYP